MIAAQSLRPNRIMLAECRSEGAAVWRLAGVAIVALGLSGCLSQAELNAKLLAAPDPCDDVMSAIDKPEPGVKPSKELSLVASFACQYGKHVSWARDDCSINPHFPELFGEEGENYGLKPKTAIVLIDAQAYGWEVGHRGHTWRIVDGEVTSHDHEACMAAIDGDDMPDEFRDLVKFTRDLRRYGY
jgi:hypothetical protein